MQGRSERTLRCAGVPDEGGELSGFRGVAKEVLKNQTGVRASGLRVHENLSRKRQIGFRGVTDGADTQHGNASGLANRLEVCRFQVPGESARFAAHLEFLNRRFKDFPGRHDVADQKTRLSSQLLEQAAVGIVAPDDEIPDSKARLQPPREAGGENDGGFLIRKEPLKRIGRALSRDSERPDLRTQTPGLHRTKAGALKLQRKNDGDHGVLAPGSGLRSRIS